MIKISLKTSCLVFSEHEDNRVRTLPGVGSNSQENVLGQSISNMSVPGALRTNDSAKCFCANHMKTHVQAHFKHKKSICELLKPRRGHRYYMACGIRARPWHFHTPLF